MLSIDASLITVKSGSTRDWRRLCISWRLTSAATPGVRTLVRLVGGATSGRLGVGASKSSGTVARGAPPARDITELLRPTVAYDTSGSTSDSSEVALTGGVGAVGAAGAAEPLGALLGAPDDAGAAVTAGGSTGAGAASAAALDALEGLAAGAGAGAAAVAVEATDGVDSSDSTSDVGRLSSPCFEDARDSSTRGCDARGTYSDEPAVRSKNPPDDGWKLTGRGLAGCASRCGCGDGAIARSGTSSAFGRGAYAADVRFACNGTLPGTIDDVRTGARPEYRLDAAAEAAAAEEAAAADAERDKESGRYRC